MEKLKRLINAHKLGLRIIKTGVAVTLCLMLAYAFRLQYPFYAVIATVIAMGKSIDISFKTGKNRMIGTFVGAAIGMLFAMLGPGNAGLCGVGIILTLYCCHIFKLTDSAPIACIVFSAIMLNLKDAIPWQYAAGRLLDTLVGIVVALLVNLFIMPPNCAGQIKQQHSALCALVRAAAASAATGGNIDSKAVHAAIERLSATVEVYVAEAKLLRSSDAEVFAVSCKLAAFRRIWLELTCVESMDAWPPKAPELRPVYDYHMGRLAALCTEALPE